MQHEQLRDKHRLQLDVSSAVGQVLYFIKYRLDAESPQVRVSAVACLRSRLDSFRGLNAYIPLKHRLERLMIPQIRQSIT